MTNEPEADGQRDAWGKQQFNVYLPPELVRELKHAAIDDRRSLSRYVEQIFRDYLERRKREEPA
jgi:predicted HicB family RNase H-like nuclease